jgi:hypothetical protein
LAGDPNSTQPNLSLLYQMTTATDDPVSSKLAYPPQYNSSYASLPAGTNPHQNSYSQTVGPQTSDAARRSSIATGPEKYSPLGAGGVTTSDANLLLGLNASYSESRAPSNYSHQTPSSQRGSQASTYAYNMPSEATGQQPGHSHMTSRVPNTQPGIGPHGGDVFIESQDIDMNSLQHQSNLPFAFNGDVLPWLEYLPQDVLDYFGEHQTYPHLMSSDGGNPRPSQ